MRDWLLAAMVLMAIATVGAATPPFTLAPGAQIEGERLVVEIREDAARRDCRCEAPLDLAPWLEGADGVLVRVLVQAEGVGEPDKPWNGVKAQLRCVDAENGRIRWIGANLPTGTWGWRWAEMRLGGLSATLPEGGRATLVLGLEGCTGRAEFDLASLRIEREPLPVPRVNGDWIVNYPTTPKRRQSLRGCMLPGRATTETDIETLASWGVTLVRFQIVRGFGKVGVGADLDEYFQWLYGRLDNLADVLDWCASRGIKVCVDLHSPPGGNSGLRQAEQYAMFEDDLYAWAFVAAWRCIASRVAGHPALYGYDLINEPNQRGPASNSYWTLQRRAAEAVREIDPATPIVVEANLSDAPSAFRYLSPLAMDNVIYEVHFYSPGDYTHQGVGNRPRHAEERPLTWPGVSPEGRRWDAGHMRHVLEPVREFQRRHGARIYVGEFSAIAWAPGAENWLRDAIDLFEEYGWDWTYHAFREWNAWSVEHEGPDARHLVPSADNPRKRAILEGLRREP
jgi:hypothetical protein